MRLGTRQREKKRNPGTNISIVTHAVPFVVRLLGDMEGATV